MAPHGRAQHPRILPPVPAGVNGRPKRNGKNEWYCRYPHQQIQHNAQPLGILPLFTRQPAGRFPRSNSSSGRCPLSNPPIQLARRCNSLPKSTSSVLRVVIVDIPRSVIHPLLVGPWPPSTRAVRNPEIHPPTRRFGPRAVPPHPLFSSRQHVPPVSHAKCAVTSAQATTHPPPRPLDLTPPIPITAPYHLGGPLL